MNRRRIINSLSSLPLVTAVMVLAIFAAACSDDRQPTGEFHDLPSDGWPYGMVVELTINGNENYVPDSTLVLAVRHANDYPYANLWLEVAYSAADSTVPEAVDTFDVRLSDEFGKWLGKGTGPSVLRPDTITLRHRPAAGTKFVVRHIMRVDTLRSIEQIGIMPLAGNDKP